MATRREQIDSRGKSLLQLLQDQEGIMANLMNPSSRDQNTYTGPIPDKPVDILWPKNASEIGTPVDISVQYFLREFNLDGIASNTIGSGRKTQGGGDGVLTHEEQFSDVEWDHVSESRRYQGKQHNQPYLEGKSGYATNRPAFMKKSQRKSLATLYWEMRGAFVNNENRGYLAAQGSDGQDKTFTNR